MNTLFEKISRLSYPMTLFIASFLTLITVLPLSIYLTRRQTNIVSRAVQTSSLPTPKPSPIDGPVPTRQPIISRVYPWVGKVADAIIIEGSNFGTYPKNRRLAIGGVVVPDSAIAEWTDTRIEAIIPPGVQQGIPASLRIDTYPIVESVPLVFYNEKTPVRLTKQGASISISGATGVVKAILYTQNGTRETQISLNSQLIPLFTLSPAEEIQSILLTDDKGTPTPYSINPTEFGF